MPTNEKNDPETWLQVSILTLRQSVHRARVRQSEATSNDNS